MKKLFLWGAVAVAMVVIPACTCDDDPIGSSVGWLEVQATTTGNAVDADGYSVSVDGGTAVSLAANGSATVSNLQPGSRSVLLSGLDGACTVSGANPTTVTVIAGDTASTAFAVVCTAPTGAVIVTTSTTGANIDADGYSVAVGADSMAIGSADTVTFPGLFAGDYAVTLGGIADNCAVADSASRTATLSGGDTATVDFPVVCQSTGSTITVTTATTGQNIDPNGYAVTITADSLDVGINDTVAFSGVPAGSDTVRLIGVANNCTVTGSTKRAVTLSGSDSTTVAYVVTCQTAPPSGLGSVRVTTATTGVGIDPDGYTATIGGIGMPVVVNGEVTFSNVPAGTRTVVLSGVASNCTVAGTTTRSASVTSGVTVTVGYQVDCQAVAPAYADWIVYTSTQDGNDEVYRIRPDGTGAVNLTLNAAVDGQAAWSPDSTRIAFRSNRDGDGEIFVMNADGTGLAQVTNNTSAEDSPAWSPDGMMLAYVSDRDGNREIYVSNVDGTGELNVSNDPGVDEDPAWSGDGTLIAFASDRPADGDADIYTVSPDGTGAVNLTNIAGNDIEPVWSPDNTQIAFTSNRDGNSEIYVMAADGTGAVNLTNNAASEEVAAWSPDGSQLAFTTTRDGNREIYVMDADGSGVTRVTNTATDERHPAWGRAAVSP